MTGFHWKDNIFFKRLNNGSVQITKLKPNAQPTDASKKVMIEHQYVIPPSEWMSIIASVSLDGATTAKMKAAKDLHG